MIAAAAIWWAASAAALDVDAFFEIFAEKRGTVETVQAAFEQINVYPTDAEMSGGSIVFAAPDRLVLRYEDPEVAYHVDGDAVFEYDAEIRQVLVIPIDYAPDAEAFILAFSNRPERLKELYEVSLVEPEPGDDLGPVLVLKPRPSYDDIEPPFLQAQLKLRDSDYLPTHIYIERDADTQVNILVKEIVVNEELAENAARIFVPQGTDIIQDDTLVETVGEEGRWLPDPALIADISAPAVEADGDDEDAANISVDSPESP
jgi:outer membrane lipoprotein-sorting protein